MVSQGKHKNSLAAFENFNLISFSDFQLEDFTPGKVVGTTVKNFHVFASLLLPPPVPFCPREWLRVAAELT